MSDVVTIACTSGKIFSACTTDEADDNDFQKEVGWYAKQGCKVETKNSGEWQFERCDCEHCQSLKHYYPED
jgi:hypothetical protein